MHLVCVRIWLHKELREGCSPVYSYLRVSLTGYSKAYLWGSMIKIALFKPDVFEKKNLPTIAKALVVARLDCCSLHTRGGCPWK